MIHSRSVAMALGAAIVALWVFAAPAQETAKVDLPLAAPVKLLQAQDVRPERTPEEAMVRRPRPQPTLPSGKLPQYQLGHETNTTSAAEAQDGELRFFLALPSQPILVEAVITIDGRPYQLARERRIKQILQEAAGPASEPEPTPEDAEEPQNPESEQTADVDPAAAPYALPTTATETVRRYVAATGRAASPEELRWLLATRIDGPVLLMLNDIFQRFRAGQRPAFHVLDRDRDGAVSAAELERAVVSFQECDLNRDGVIDFTEIAEAAKDPRRESAGDVGGKLLYRIGDAASLDGVQAPIPPRLDGNGNGRLDPEELTAVQDAEPDLKLAVAFNTTNPGDATIAVTAIHPEFQDAAAEAAAEGATITLPLAGALVAISAVQTGGSDQISLGAVNDGYPLLPVIDPNDDGRFTVRELRELAARLRRFDRNGDGGLTSEEIPPTIRVCFGLGPLVHRELAGIRSVNRRTASPPVAAPPWFVRMDRNKDNDLTRGEFPGTDDQFQALDADRDGLVSGQEAADYDRQATSPPE